MENKILVLLDGRPITWLAERSSVPRNTINSIIKGASPRLDNAYKIANALKVSVYDIWPDITQNKE